MTAHVAADVAMATAAEFFARNRSAHPQVVIGKDTRLSGYLLESAMEAGFLSMGMDVVLTGPLPTPAVANITRSLRAGLGVVISASHNPYQDNGIKIFRRRRLQAAESTGSAPSKHRVAERELGPCRPVDGIGKARRMDDATGRYIEIVKHTLPRGLRLDGLEESWSTPPMAPPTAPRPQALFELGATVDPDRLFDPDGTNINADCGATEPQALARKVC